MSREKCVGDKDQAKAKELLLRQHLSRGHMAKILTYGVEDFAFVPKRTMVQKRWGSVDRIWRPATAVPVKLKP